MRLIRSALLVLCVAAASRAQQEIKVGGIFDLTGITSDVGKPYAQGVRDGVDAKHGFFLVPLDARTNTRRIYVAREATSDIKDG